MVLLFYQIALKYLFARKRQSSLAILAVGLGVAVYIIISALVNGNEKSFIEQAIDTSPHIIISDDAFDQSSIQPAYLAASDSSIIFISSILPSTAHEGIKNADSIINIMGEKYPNIYASAVLKKQTILKRGIIEIASTTFGIDPEKHDKVAKLSENISHGSLNGLRNSENALILGIGLAKRLNVYIGNNIDIIASSGNKRRMQVVGLLQTGITNIDEYSSYILLNEAQILNQKPNLINEIQIKVQDVAQADHLARMIENDFHYPTKSWIQLAANIFSIFKLQRVIIFVVVTTILLMASFGMYNMIASIVYEKYKDIAILRSMGFRNRDVKIIFLFMGLIICIFGIIIGWIMATTGIYLLGLIRVEIIGFVKIDHLILDNKIELYFYSGILATFVCCLSTLLSISKAMRINPVDTIRISV